MTRGEIRDAIIEQLREAAVPVRWSVQELNEYIDDGYGDMALATGAVVATVQITCPATEHYIDLPIDCVYPIAIKDVSTGEPVDPVHWLYIDKYINPLWARINGSRPDVFCAFGLNKVVLYPAFDSSGTLEIIYSQSPTGLTSDNTVPNLPVQYHVGLIHYGMHRALLKDADLPRLRRSLRHAGFFKSSIGELSKWADNRHEAIFTAIYGNRHRVVEYT